MNPLNGVREHSRILTYKEETNYLSVTFLKICFLALSIASTERMILLKYLKI